MILRKQGRCAALARAAFATFAMLVPIHYAVASCGAAFCMVNTNWNMQGHAPEPGLRLDLRFEYIDQDRPRTADREIAFGSIRRHHDELRTINRNYIATFDYTFNRDWAVVTTVPMVDRSHAHIHNHGGAQLFDAWNFSGLGDVTVVARRQWMSEDAQAPRLSFYGINVGVKAPTGDFKVRNGANDLAERSLQPGTGTSDLLLGAYYSRVMPNESSSWFVQTLWQAAINKRDDYRRGRRLSFDAGYRFEATDRIGLMFQVNGLFKGRDSGAQAEPDDTGGRFLYLSPGISYAATKGIQLYAFFQQPVYHRVNGVQVVADWSIVSGVNVRF